MSNPNRAPRGIPTGGQFASGAHTASGVALDQPSMPGDTWVRDGWQDHDFDQTEAAQYVADGFDVAEAQRHRTAVKHCVLAALWSSTDEDGESLDANYEDSDLAEATRAEMSEDLRSFMQSNRDDLAGMEPKQVGHDFWLTKNHHGAGFWDRGLGERGDRLTEAAHVYGGTDLYVGDDGLIYG